MRVLRTAASAGTHPQSTPLQQPHAPAPAASFLNQGNMLSLPVLTDSLRALWVLSDQACQQLAELDTMAELVEAFNTFPYPTRWEMAALALRCSLHLDQVRVWFMIQRLRYGLSWDSEDICEVRQRLLLGSASCSGQTQGDEVEEGGQDKRREKASEGQGEEDRMDGKPEGEHEVEEEGVSVAEKRREGGNGEGKTMGQERGGISRKKLGRLMGEAEKRRKARYRDKKKTETAAKSKQKKATCLKGMDQVKLLRDMFMARSFPTSDDYDRLVSQMGLSRSCVVNWFAYLRFRIKHGNNPVWLTKHTCDLIRRRIKYRYKMKALAKEKAIKGNQH